jgi:hypothetical protein
MIHFQAVLLLLQQNMKYKALRIVAHLPDMDTAVIPNSKSGFVSGNSMNRFQIAI